MKKTTLIKNDKPLSVKVAIGIPTTGQIRYEWHSAFNQILVPTSWLHGTFSPIGYQVAPARNLIVEGALEDGFEWVLFIDHDVILPQDFFIKMRGHMTSMESPVVSGVYYTKSSVPEPLIYRKSGQGPHYDWEPGDKVWARGIGMGTTLIHASILRNMQSPWFYTPNELVTDENGHVRGKMAGTEDLHWCERVIQENIYEKAGWDPAPDPENPFLVDTSIMCGHISQSSGKVYPDCMGDAHMVNHRAAQKAMKKYSRKSRE